MEIIDKVEDLLTSKLGSKSIIRRDELSTPKALVVDSDEILEICTLLHKTEGFYFDLLSCITGIDNGPEANSMEVIYHLSSIPIGHQLTLKVELDRSHPVVTSVSSIWKTANWHERETYDLFGITFSDHPDLRRILMPGDWEGHPLRKDYEEPEAYRGMKTIREETDNL